MADSPLSHAKAAYRVLARKYRPQNFDQLIGQDALVRTLTNAIQSGRVAHAFMLTGVRGVGKTTTARIIAKALNYKGPDGTSGPTTGPTDDCALCRAITEDRHPDVIEMDAATRTGVDDMREILDGVRYAPTEARYKIYIIDEVHMLSKNAFNALLKTLEEPPAHVKFIFATTEIRKVPITVLSRCQRFDLRRVEIPVLEKHYADICGKEQVEAEPEALSMLARAADGSVRDGLSLLDQAIALGGGTDDKIMITAAQMRDMLGLADRARSMDLLQEALSGDMGRALGILDEIYRSGGDALALLQDLLDLTHLLSRLRAAPDAQSSLSVMAAAELDRAAALAKQLGMPALGKTWQILLKGLTELQGAPSPYKALEMIIIRLAYAADLPDPADLLRKLKDTQTTAGPNGFIPSGSPVRETMATQHTGRGGQALNLQQQSAPQEQFETTTIQNLPDMVKMLDAGGCILLAQYVYQHVRLIRLEQGRLEMALTPEAPPRLAQDLTQELLRLTGTRWMVTVSGALGQPTLAEQAAAAQNAVLTEVLQFPAVQEIMAIFPGAELKAVLPPETKS
jgi:DNA polymerase-3 subunit gamma/tau